jgi:hypothetical protein
MERERDGERKGEVDGEKGRGRWREEREMWILFGSRIFYKYGYYR